MENRAEYLRLKAGTADLTSHLECAPAFRGFIFGSSQYRGVYVYYQKSGKHYPIEIQFNILFDRQLNTWLHNYLYKKSCPIETGCIMREKYESGLIRNEHEFKEVLNNVLSGSERS